ncbi:AAA family ATPase [Paraburkholderia strydomiana]|jgi:predicted ATPase|uniref:AAA family ATPase n=1 Tax=Paraburkholderia strydomiana TaxID=1245417 RepID=UPI0038BC200A
MAKIEGIRIRNFRALKDVTMGKLWNSQAADPLSAMTAVIGKNGVGKSTFFDVFGFLSDCLRGGVEEACDARGRGGFDRIRSQGQSGPIEFEIYYKEDGNARPITYEIIISVDLEGRPYVQKERLRQRRKNQSWGRPFSFLFLTEGKGVVWKGDADVSKSEVDEEDAADMLESLLREASAEESSTTEVVELSDKRKLGIATLGSLKQHPRISAFRQFIEGWYLSYFTPDAARSLPLAGPQKHLNIHGDNLGNVVQFMEREHSRRFQQILNRISEKIPGIDRISTAKTADGRLLLQFNDRGFKDPFFCAADVRWHFEGLCLLAFA